MVVSSQGKSGDFNTSEGREKNIGVAVWMMLFLYKEGKFVENLSVLLK